MRRHVVVPTALWAALAVLSATFAGVARAQDEPPPQVVLTKQGLQLEGKCDIEGALSAYRKALNESSSSPDSTLLLAIARLSDDETDLKAVAKAAEAQAGSVGGLLPPSVVAAAAYAKLGDDEKSKEILTAAARQAEERTGATMKPMARAIRDMAALEPDVRSPLIVALLGTSSFCHRSKQAGAKQLQTVARNKIESGYVRLIIAVGLAMAGRMDLAREEAKKAEPAGKDDPDLAKLLQMFQAPPTPPKE